VKLTEKVKGALIARVFDNNERLLLEQAASLSGDADSAILEMVMPETRVVAHSLEVDLVTGGGAVDRRRVRFGVQQEVDIEDFHLGYWGPKGGPPYPYVHFQWLQWQRGVDFGMFGGLPLGNIRMLDYAGFAPRVVWQRPAKRLPCRQDPDFRRKVEEAMRKRIAPHAQWSAYCMTLGDEPSFRWQCTSPQCAAGFRKYVQRQFGSIERLNQVWGSKYGKWENVDQMAVHQAQKRFDGNGAAGHSAWRYTSKVVADFYVWQQKLIDEMVPGLRAGPEGIWANPEYYHLDYVRLLKSCGFLGTYPDKDTMAAARAFGNPRLLIGPWYGSYSYSNPASLRAVPWQALLEGLNACMWFEGSRPRHAPVVMPVANGDWTLNAVAAPSFAEVRRIKSGIGKLLLTSRRLDDGILILYPTLSASKSFVSWTLLLETLGYQVGLATEEQIERGMLSNGCRLLIVSEAPHVSDTAAQHIEQFVRSGGNLFVDRNSGTLTKHGKPRPVGALDGVCGIAARMEEPQRGPQQIEAPHLGDGSEPPLSVNVSRIGQVVTAHPACVRGVVKGTDIPAGISRTLGKGKTLYLNASLAEFEKDARSHLELMSVLMDWIDLPPPVSFTVDADTPMGLQIVRYERGPLELIAVHRQTTRLFRPDCPGWRDDWTVSLKFPSPAHLYDVYAGRYLAHTERWTGRLSYGKPVLLARLPSAAKRIVAEPARIEAKQGDTVEYAARILFDRPLPDGHPYSGVARIEFLDPAGRPVPFLNRNAEFHNGRIACRWPVALNEKPGAWTISITDVGTGANCRVGVKSVPFVTSQAAHN